MIFREENEKLTLKEEKQNSKGKLKRKMKVQSHHIIERGKRNLPLKKFLKKKRKKKDEREYIRGDY